MKNRKIHSLAAAALAVVLALTGCGGEKKDRADIEATVGRFMESAFAMDKDGVLACVDKNSDYYEYCAENGAFELSSEGLGLEDDDIFGSQAFLDGIRDLTEKHSDYALDSVEFDGKDKAVATVTVTLPDFEGLDLTEAMSLDDIGFDMEDFLAFAQEKGYDSQALVGLSVSDPSAGEALVNDYMNSSGYQDKIVSGVLTAMDENVTADSNKTELTLERFKDGWKITDENEAQQDGQDKE